MFNLISLKRVRICGSSPTTRGSNSGRRHPVIRQYFVAEHEKQLTVMRTVPPSRAFTIKSNFFFLIRLLKYLKAFVCGRFYLTGTLTTTSTPDTNSKANANNADSKGIIICRVSSVEAAVRNNFSGSFTMQGAII